MSKVKIHNFKLGMLEVYLEKGEGTFVDGVKYNSTGLALILNKNQKVVTNFKNQQQELINKFCAFDTDGNPIIQDGGYVFDDAEDKKIFHERLEKLLNEEVELSL